MIIISKAPRDSAEFISSACLEVYEILKRYITVHDEIFSFSIRRLIPLPFIFKEIDFQTVYRDCRFRERELYEVIEQLPNKSFEASNLLMVLREYSSALLKTISKLKVISEKLWKKADKEIKYEKPEYKSDLEDYFSCVQKYQEIGRRLNLILNLMR